VIQDHRILEERHKRTRKMIDAVNLTVALPPFSLCILG
jgi:hypothetical protein